MAEQKEINQDLGHYLTERKKTQPLWQRVFGKKPRPKEVVQEEIKEELEQKAAQEHIAPEDKKELETMEQNIESVDKIEREVEEKIEEEHEGVLKRFFKKLRGPKAEPASYDDVPVEDSHTETAQEPSTATDVDTREVLKRLHEWIKQLPPEKLQEFKNSEDFKLYTTLLKKHNLIR